MRLTLRTLLSWLDDTLPPDEVRRLGQQVQESSYAREITERIQRVTRRRRLTVPSSSGPDGTDPNLVADYLDNVLPSDQVEAFERLCLRSDVHLAEAASCHQVLSLLGQKAKVPPEARYRMYQLVHGQETEGRRALRSPERVRPEPVVGQATARMPAPSERTSVSWPLAAAILAIVALLGYSTWYNLSPGTLPRRPVEELVAAQVPAAVAPPIATPETEAPVVSAVAPAAAPPGPAMASETEANATSTEGPSTAEPGPATTADADTEAAPPAGEPEVAPAIAPAASAAPVVASTDGVLLHRVATDPVWVRLAAGDRVEGGTLVNLEPFRSLVQVGGGRLRLVGESRFDLASGAEPGQPPRLDLIHGRAVYQAGRDGEGITIGTGAGSLRLAPPAGVPVGLERGQRGSQAQRAGQAVPLTLHLSSGTLDLAGTEVRGPARVEVGGDGAIVRQEPEDPLAWVVEAAAPPLEVERARQFLRSFRDDRPAKTSLAEAAGSERSEMRALALRGLVTLGLLTPVVDSLAREGQPSARRAAIAALRDLLARDAKSPEEIRTELARLVGDGPRATDALQLLAGTAPEAADDPATRSRLVALLEADDLALRELALDNLKAITRRGDDLGYDADKPTREAVDAWREAATPRPSRRNAPTPDARGANR